MRETKQERVRTSENESEEARANKEKARMSENKEEKTRKSKNE